MVLTLTAELAVQLPAMLGEGSIWDSRGTAAHGRKIWSRSACKKPPCTPPSLRLAETALVGYLRQLGRNGAHCASFL